MNPVIYFPDEGRIRVAKKIILKIIFTPNPANKKNIGNTQPNNINDNYSSHFIKSPVNIGPNNPGAPHLLIVTADNYYNSIKPLKKKKNRTGYVTNILKTSQINSNPSDSDIKSAIKDSFNNGSAQYVLLVGDWFDIPNFFGVTNLYSDHYYSTMNDTDFLPDLVLGRLPVIDIADCDLYVRKTIKYESRPDTGQGINWYKKATSAASNSNLDDWHGRNVVHFFKEHHFISVDDFRGSQNRFTGANIKSAIDSGRSWMFYIGHGDRKSWSVPDVFSNNNVQSLLNTNMLPAVVSIACANAKISNPDICFGQKWMNVADNRGACVFLGATDDTYFLYSDTLGKYAMFSYVNGETETFGDAMNYGKLLMYQCFPPDTNTFATQETIELFIILGDPTIMPWTDIPHPVTADYPHPILPGTNNISFTVKSGDTIVKHAMVSLTNKDFTFRRFAYSDSLGNVSFNGPFPNQGHIYIVISGHNLYPLFDSIRTDTATSIENYYSTNLQVELYPQPFSSNCRVKISGSLNKISSAEILNMQGSVCREIRDINSNEFIIEKGNLASGMYLLKLADGQNRYYYHKLIVN